MHTYTYWASFIISSERTGQLPLQSSSYRLVPPFTGKHGQHFTMLESRSEALSTRQQRPLSYDQMTAVGEETTWRVKIRIIYLEITFCLVSLLFALLDKHLSSTMFMRFVKHLCIYSFNDLFKYSLDLYIWKQITAETNNIFFHLFLCFGLFVDKRFWFQLFELNAPGRNLQWGRRCWHKLKVKYFQHLPTA